MSDDTYPDVEGAVRTWLRADTGVAALVGTRVFFGVPKSGAVWPLVTVARVGGGNAVGDAPIDEAQLQIDCWGSIRDNGTGNKAEAHAVANAVRSALRIPGDTLIATGVRAAISDDVTVTFAPDPDNDRPRYIVQAVGSFWAV